MCGPTLVVRRENKAGDKLFCRNCEGEFTLEGDAHNALTAQPTGGLGTAMDLEAEADEALISRSIKESMSDAYTGVTRISSLNQGLRSLTIN